MSAATTALGNRSDIALSTVSFWTNVGGQLVWDSMPHDLQEKLAVSSTTSGSDKITLPSDFLELLTVSNLSSGMPSLLDPLNADQADSAYDPTQLGTPERYLLFSTWLELRPSPDSSYSIQLRYRAQWSDLTATTDVPSIATRLRYGIMLKTTELLARHVVQDDAKAQWAHQEYLQHMTMEPSDRALRTREQHAMGLSLGRLRGQVTKQSSNLSFDRRIS